MSSLAAAAAAAAALSSECRDKNEQLNKSNLLMLGNGMESDEKVSPHLKHFLGKVLVSISPAPTFLLECR
jgi:hypothetical protein